MAKAADHVIITADEIIPTEMVMADPTRTTVPGFLVNSVVRMPFSRPSRLLSHTLQRR